MIPRVATVAVLTAPGQLEMQQQELAPLGADEILCETISSMISPGTELAAYRGLPPLRPSVVYPRVQGYCNVARVLAVGDKVTGLAPGDRVLTHMSHRSHFVIPQAQVLVQLEADADAAMVACAYLFHLGYSAVLSGNVRPGSRVTVVGLGVLGLTSVAMAALAGAQVSAVSEHERSNDIARHMGAATVWPRKDLDAALDGEMPLSDVVISTTNAWSDWTRALRIAALRGTIAVLGFPGRGEPPPATNPLDSQYFYQKQLRIEATGLVAEHADPRGFNRFNQRDNLRFLVDQIASGRLNPAPLVAGSFAGRELDQAYRSLMNRDNGAITYELKWAN